MAFLKSILKTALRPLRTTGSRFFSIPDFSDTLIWKAAQLSVGELIEGDYLEFGVFQGDSFVQASVVIREAYDGAAIDANHSPQHMKRVREMWDEMRFFVFDSFRGLPPPTGLDSRTSDFAEGQYACMLPSFLNDLKRRGVDLGKVVAVPGWFEETCTKETIKKYNIKSASIVHIDCDLYESTKVVLKFIEPLLVDGTVLIFDDWYCFRGNPELGEQRAFREWARDKPNWTFTQYQKEGSRRNSFIANFRGAEPVGGSGPAVV